MKPNDIHEAILLAAIPSGIFGVLFGLNYDVNSKDADSTLTISSLGSLVTLPVLIALTNGIH